MSQVPGPLGLPADAPNIRDEQYHEDAHHCPGLGRAHFALCFCPVREGGTARRKLRRQSVRAKFWGRRCLPKLPADVVLLVVKFEQLSRRAVRRLAVEKSVVR
jgi:hypothetical protein